MGVLYAKVAGAWVPISGTNDEVAVGPDDPIGLYPQTELWYDTDANTFGSSDYPPRGILGWKAFNGDSGAVGNVETNLNEFVFTFTIPGIAARTVLLQSNLEIVHPGGGTNDLVWSRLKVDGVKRAESLMSHAINGYMSHFPNAVCLLNPGVHQFDLSLQTSGGTCFTTGTSSVAVIDIGPSKAAN